MRCFNYITKITSAVAVFLVISGFDSFSQQKGTSKNDQPDNRPYRLTAEKIEIFPGNMETRIPFDLLDSLGNRIPDTYWISSDINVAFYEYDERYDSGFIRCRSFDCEGETEIYTYADGIKYSCQVIARQIRGWSEVHIRPKFNSDGCTDFEEWLDSKKPILDDYIAGDETKSILVRYVIDKKGNVGSVRVVQGFEPKMYPEIEALVMSSPRWEPAIYEGKKVPVFSGARIRYDKYKEKPSFNGGTFSDFMIWMKGLVKYPEIAKENGVQGTVGYQFTIDETGKVKDVTITDRVDPALDGLIWEIISSSPPWKPAVNWQGEKVAYTYTGTFTFYLR